MKIYFFLLFFALGIFSSIHTESPLSLTELYGEHSLDHSEEKEPPQFQEKFFRMLYILGFLLSVMIAILWIIKKVTQPKIAWNKGKNKENAITILEIRPLSNRSTLYLIEVNGREMLIAESPSGVSIIEASAEPATKRV